MIGLIVAKAFSGGDDLRYQSSKVQREFSLFSMSVVLGGHCSDVLSKSRSKAFNICLDIDPITDPEEPDTS